MSWKEIGTVLFLFFIGVALADTNKELKIISHLESSNGKNLNHPIIKKGMHKGHQAGGKYGLMPLTVSHLVEKNRELDKYNYLLDLSPKKVTSELNRNPVMDKAIASLFWNKLRKKYGPCRSAYAWYYGPNRAKYVSQEDVLDSEYVKKFTKEIKINEVKIKCSRPMGFSTTR